MKNSTKNFLGKRIVVMTAHPDDEGIAAGTMYANHKAGGATILVCATYGEKGKSHLAKPVSDAALKRIRKAELEKAAKILKIDKVVFLGIPDAAVKANEKILYERSLPLIAKIAPDRILSFGPDGMSAHWDHITVGKVALRIAKELRIPLAAFTRADDRLSPEEREKRNAMFLARRKFGAYAGVPKHRKGDIKIKVDFAVKARAMRVHVSQFGPRGGYMAQFPKAVAMRMFAYEYYVNERI